ncbi:ALA-interacting subunit 3 [Striga hermonthica]|uniref:ALA-interacting subunit 3 n=1 Tax=Striga hermonthica TaxID=68872 RepID=A0A9N7MUK3_STRHE|nr:ALA-interacting subunit 3 [Striga hermonthica]
MAESRWWVSTWRWNEGLGWWLLAAVGLGPEPWVLLIPRSATPFAFPLEILRVLVVLGSGRARRKGCGQVMNSNTPSSSAGGAGSAEPTAPRRNSKRPKYSRFTQQELPACKPILTPKWVISTFLLVSVVFIPIGVVSLLASRDVVEIVHRYDAECIPVGSRNNRVGFIQSSRDKTCNRTITVPKHMGQPIYVYYQLDNFYQNHRRYVRSRNDQQLRSPGSERETSSCSPEDTTPDGNPIVPCGLIAWSLFNDTYGITRNNQELAINKRDISWKSDRDRKFGDNVFPRNFQNGTLIGGGSLNASIPLSQQEDLIRGGFGRRGGRDGERSRRQKASSEQHFVPFGSASVLLAEF